jgi:hypothetical protein
MNIQDTIVNLLKETFDDDINSSFILIKLYNEYNVI